MLDYPTKLVLYTYATNPYQYTYIAYGVVLSSTAYLTPFAQNTMVVHSQLDSYSHYVLPKPPPWPLLILCHY